MKRHLWRSLNDSVRAASRPLRVPEGREAEANEARTWIEFAVKCNYIEVEAGRELYSRYNQVLSGERKYD